MPKTKKPKPTPKPADPAKLARELVEDRLSDLFDHYTFLSPGGDDWFPGWEEVVKAALAKEYPNECERVEALSKAGEDWDADSVTATEAAHATAGFLVGLELGRRLGGAR